MKSRTALLISLTLFAAGLAGGRLMPIGQPGPVRKSPPSSTATSANDAVAPAIPGIPEPSGLPGDFIHLEEIHDPGVLRAVWLSADKGDRWPLARRWVALDPEGLIRFLFLEKADSSRLEDVQKNLLLERWLGNDPAAALRFLAQLTEEKTEGLWFLNSTATFQQAIESRLKDAPEQTLALFRAGSSTMKNLMCYQVFEWLFKTNPSLALAEIENLSPSLARTAWSKARETTDPAALLKLIGARKNISCPADDYRSIFDAYTSQDPAAAQSMAENMPPGPCRDAACSIIVNNMVKADPNAALAWLETYAPRQGNRSVVYAALAETDPALALEMSSHSQVPFCFEVCKYIQNLSAQDWSAAENLVSQAPNAWARNRIISALAYGLNTKHGTALSDLPKLESLLGPVKPEKDESVLQPHQFSGNPSEELPALMDWVKRQPAKAMDEILPPLTDRLEKEGPAAAADWLTQLPPGRARTTALIRNTSAWASEDPQAAAQFSLNLPPGTDHDYAILNTALAWQHYDPAAARQWVESLPDSPVKTRTLKELGGASSLR